MKKNWFVDTAIRYVLSYTIALFGIWVLHWTIAWCISPAKESYLYHDYVKPEHAVDSAVDDSINHDENQSVELTPVN